MAITREQYEAAIPKCCAYQTMEAHEILLCWGLASAVDKGKEMNCSGCTENTMRDTEAHNDTGERQNEQDN